MHDRGSGFHGLILLTFSLLLLACYSPYLFEETIPSVDLYGHLALMKQWRGLLLTGQLDFFDRFAFLGWPALTFYAFGAHLVTCLMSLPLGLVSSDPVFLAVRILIVAGFAALPWSMFYASSGLARELTAEEPSCSRQALLLLSMTVGALSFWYLGSGQDGYGIGASSIVHGGFYPQLFGWHLFLIVVGQVVAIMRGERASIVAPLIVTGLLLTHTLSAAYAGFVGLLALAFVPRGGRLDLIRAFGIGTGLSLFWLLPCVVLTSPYTFLDIEPWIGNPWQIFVRYSLGDLANLLSEWRNIPSFRLPFTELILTLLLPLFLLTRRARSGGTVLRRLALILTLTALLVWSNILPTTLSLGLHYYRFASPMVLLATVIASVAPLTFLPRTAAPRRIVVALIATASVLSFATTITHPNGTLVAIRSGALRSRYQLDEEMARYLSGQPGRTLFEYFDDGRVFPVRSPHYIYSLLATRGIESANGLFIQSSASWVFLASRLRALGGRAYLFDTPGRFDPPLNALRDLAALGVARIIAYSDGLRNQLARLPAQETAALGPYHIFALDDALVRSTREREVVGYFDLEGSVPFKLMSLLFASHPGLRDRFELVELINPNGNEDLVRVVIVNGVAAQTTDRAVLSLRVDDSRVPKQGLEIDPEMRAYLALEIAVGEQVVPRLLNSAPKLRAIPTATNFSWTREGRELLVRAGEPGVPLVIPYSFFPFWKPESGRLFRATDERMLLVPTAIETRLVYSRWHHWSAWIGAVASLLALGILLVSARRAATGTGY